MKSCKACFKEIDDRATKCPHCQAFQQKWRNPQFFSLIFIIPMMLLPLYMTGLFNKPVFADYRKDIVLTEQKSIPGDKDSIRFIIEIDNRTKKKWEHPLVRILFKDANGGIVGVANEENYKFQAQPNTKSLLEIATKLPANAATHTIELVTMRAPILND